MRKTLSTVLVYTKYVYLAEFLKNFLWSPLCTFLENVGFDNNMIVMIMMEIRMMMMMMMIMMMIMIFSIY